MRWTFHAELEHSFYGDGYSVRYSVYEQGLRSGDKGGAWHHERHISTDCILLDSLVEDELKFMSRSLVDFIRDEKKKAEDRQLDPVKLLAEALSEWRKEK